MQALTKFLKSVNWTVTQEAKQALELLERWSAMDVEDALELLSPAFSHPAVRKYAVTRLQQAEDEVSGNFQKILGFQSFFFKMYNSYSC